jgi:hypothetical protein
LGAAVGVVLALAGPCRLLERVAPDELIAAVAVTAATTAAS